jgi:hypothetical protein
MTFGFATETAASHGQHYILQKLVTIIQGVPGGTDLTSGEYSLGQTIPI